MDENRNENPFTIKIEDPELIRKLQEGGVENLDSNDIYSLGLEVDDDHISMGDASNINADGVNRLRINTFANGNSGPSPFRRGLFKFIAIMAVIAIVFCVACVVVIGMFPDVPLAIDEVIGLSLVFVFGVGLGAYPFYCESVAKKNLTECVNAKCISVDRSSSDSRTRRSVFEYTYNGKVYRSCESTYSNRGYARIGEEREIWVLPENPSIIFDPTANKARKAGKILIGTIFVGIVALIVACLFING